MSERTIDLSHVTIDSFAKAIGNEPEKAFAFIPLEYPPAESNIGGEPVRFLLGNLNPNTSSY